MTFAVYVLGGDTASVDTEDIAKKSNELAPGRFSWSKYPDQINIELIRVFLSDAKKTANGAMLSGAGKSGWRLTKSGLLWVKSIEEREKNIDYASERGHRRARSPNVARVTREKTRIIRSRAWKSWQSGIRNITLENGQEIFRIDSFSSPVMRERKLVRLISMFASDPEISEFIIAAANLISTEKSRNGDD